MCIRDRLDGHPYEIFTGLQDDDEGILLPKSVSSGRIIKNIDEDEMCIRDRLPSACYNHELQILQKFDSFLCKVLFLSLIHSYVGIMKPEE